MSTQDDNAALGKEPAPAPGTVTRLFAPALIDEPEVAPSRSRDSGTQPQRRRGRPKGSTTRIAHGHVKAEEIALLRAVAQGVDVTVAARQYLMWPGRTPERPALLRHYQELLQRVEAAADTATDPKTARKMVRVLLDHQTILDEAPAGALVGATSGDLAVTVAPVAASAAVGSPEPATIPARRAVPSLEEFAARFDEDMFSEAELMDLYEEEFGGVDVAPEDALPAQTVLVTDSGAAVVLDEIPVSRDLGTEVQAVGSAMDRVKALLQAIDWLDEHLAKRPNREDRVAQWVSMSKAQIEVLRAEGVVTLGNLVDWMSLRGKAWVDKIPGYGAIRAQNLQVWLQQWSIQPGEGLSAVTSLGPKTRALVVAAPAYMQPLTQMPWPRDLDGSMGRFRTHVPNGMNAVNDIEAVREWFKVIQQKSPHTQVAYKRAIERLVLWAVHERGIALSSLVAQDMWDFMHFLESPPAHWLQTPDAERGRQSQSWRPLRQPLSGKGIAQTFAAVSSMFSYWKGKLYVSLNPAEGIGQGKRTEVTMDTSRSLTDKQLEIVGETFADLSEGVAKRRLRALFLLLENAGLRRAEVAVATWGDLKKGRIDGQDTEERVLTVRGKGDKLREVPLNQQTIDALREHLQDRLALMDEGKLAMFKNVPYAKRPLIGVLDDRTIWRRDKALAQERAQALPAAEKNNSAPLAELEALQLGSMHQGVRYTVNESGALSPMMINDVLKEFFRKCSVVAGEDPSKDDTPFLRATAHWLRHTYAHKVLRATDKDLTVVQALLGHQSITTTQIYVKADIGKRMQAVDRIKGSL